VRRRESLPASISFPVGRPHKTKRAVACQGNTTRKLNAMQTNIRQFSIAQLQIQAGFQIRAELNLAAVTEYAEAMKAGDKFPPVKVVHQNGTYILADGFHRVEAAQKAGQTSILAEIIDGNEGTALEIAIKSNRCHGLRFTIADKRRAVTSILHQWPKQSDRQIAAMVGVSPPFVATVRSELKGAYSPSVRTGADGKLRHLPVRTPKPEPCKGHSSLPQRKQSLPPRKGVVMDKTGITVPKESLTSWSEAESKADELISHVTWLVKQLEAKQEENHLMFAEVGKGMDNLIAKAKAVRGELELTMPYAVCVSCNGILEVSDCTTCRGRGWLSKFYYNNHVPEETKNIRESKLG
jgi:uncharacterized ParB-like nuclease family protein